MNRRIAGIVGAVALALVGTLVLASYVQSAREEALEGERLVAVWVVRDAIAAGTPAADIMGAIERIEVPDRVRAEGAVDDLDELDGLVTATELVAGEQLLTGRFATPTEARRGDVPDDLLQVTVELSPDRALGGLVQAGDSVGVLLSFPPFDTEGGGRTANATHLTLHKVAVTAVQFGDGAATGSPLGGGDPAIDPASATAAPGANLFVTLAVDAPQAEQVVFAAEFGGVWLAAEPGDAPEGGTRVVERGNVHGDQGL
jgi:pilus assembly protein CpaB